MKNGWVRDISHIFVVLILLFSFSLTACGGKAVVRGWTKHLGTKKWDEARGVAVDSVGSIYVTGKTGGGMDGNASAGGDDFFLVKYDSSGVKQWTRQLGTAGDDDAYGVAVDSKGNIYITGHTDGSLDGNKSLRKTDFFLVKYNPSGVKEWTRQFGTAKDDYAYGVTVDSKDNIYVTGSTEGDLDGNNKNAGRADIFLVKYDTSGAKQWTKQLGTKKWDEARGVAVDNEGNVYITGHTDDGLDGNKNAGEEVEKGGGASGSVESTPTYADIILIKYDSFGEKQWTRQLGTESREKAHSVAIDSEGNIYITGYTGGSLDGNKNKGRADLFLIKYNSSGIKQWTRQDGTGSWDEARGLAVDNEGNIYVTGDTNGKLDDNKDAGDTDIFLIKYDLSGIKQWSRQHGTGDDDYCNGVAVDSKGSIYIVGRTDEGLDGNKNVGRADLFIVKYNSSGVKQ